MSNRPRPLLAKYNLFVHFALALVVFSALSISCKSVSCSESSDVVYTERPSSLDTDLRGISFYVWGNFPEKIAGKRVHNGSVISIKKIIEARGGKIVENVHDPGIMVAVIGDVNQKFTIDDLNTRRLFIEDNNAKRVELIRHFASNGIEIITGEILIARLGLGEYSDADNPQWLNYGVWDYLYEQKETEALQSE